MGDAPIAMAEAADLGALLAVVEAAADGPDLAARGQAQAAMRAFARLLAHTQAARGLAADVSGMVSDLFGGSDPRRVAEAARGALAVYGVARGIGPGADAVRGMREGRGHGG